MSRKEKELEKLWEELEALEEEVRYTKSRIEELEDELEGEICGNCSGSGEGQYDGTSCTVCKGKGVA